MPESTANNDVDRYSVDEYRAHTDEIRARAARLRGSDLERALALALHEAFEGPHGIGQELNCWGCEVSEGDEIVGRNPKPGDVCWDLAADVLAELQRSAVSS